MADDRQDRLRKLTELRNNGTLSPGEYQIARTRLLAAGEEADHDEGSDEAGFFATWWPAFLGLGVLALMVVGLVVYGRMQAEQDLADTNVSASIDADSNSLETAPSGTELCSSANAWGMIKDQIFDLGQKQYGGDPGPLESLRKVVGVRMQYPMLRAVREGNAPAQCNGHLVIDLPPSVHAAFDGLPALEADVEFAVQDAPGGAPVVTEIRGADQIVEQLVVAASTVGGKGKAPIAEAPQPGQIYTPSFDCRGSLSNVERMICEDERLSELDVELADRYLTLRRDLPRSEWQIVSDSQREFLRRRAACPNIACLNDAYTAQTRFLARFADDREDR